MGELITFTIHEDGMEQILKDPDFAKKLYESAQRGQACEISVGYHSNLVRVQRKRHADDHTVYVHAGNTVMDMDVRFDDLSGWVNRNPQFFVKCIKIMEESLSRCRAKIVGVPMELAPKTDHDGFFDKTHCDRCGNDLKARTMSWFNKDAICMECSSNEGKLREAIRLKEGNGADLKYEGCGYIPDMPA